MFGWYYIGGFPWEWLAPLALVALGVALLLRPKVHEAAAKQVETKVDSAGLEDPVQPVTPTEEEPAEPVAEDEVTGSDDSEDSSESDDDTGDEEKSRPFDRWPLRRSRSDRVIGGVCGGLGKHFKLDSTIVRLGWAFISLASLGLGVIAYLFMLVAISEEEE